MIWLFNIWVGKSFLSNLVLLWLKYSNYQHPPPHSIALGDNLGVPRGPLSFSEIIPIISWNYAKVSLKCLRPRNYIHSDIWWSCWRIKKVRKITQVGGRGEGQHMPLLSQVSKIADQSTNTWQDDASFLTVMWVRIWVDIVLWLRRHQLANSFVRPLMSLSCELGSRSTDVRAATLGLFCCTICCFSILLLHSWCWH